MADRPARPRHWRSLDEWAETPAARQAAHDEFLPGAVAGPPGPGAPPPAGLSRRHFLGLVGTLAAAAGTACDWAQDRPDVVAYTRRPKEVVPGVATYYASTFPEGRRGYAVLVKTREGRPIHVSGNDEHPGLQGRTAPRAVADVLRLYDPDRLRAPRRLGLPVPWEAAERELHEALLAARDRGRRILLLTGASASPTRARLLAQLREALPVDLLEWEPALGEAAQVGAQAAFGAPVELRPRLHGARTILCLGADPLNGEDPEAIRGFVAGRGRFEPGAAMSRLWVLEGPMTATGARADQRLPVRPSLIPGLAFALARDLRRRHGLPVPGGVDLPAGLEALPARAGIGARAWAALLDDLRAAGPRAVVLCGDAMAPEAQVATHLLNAMLGGEALDRRPAAPLATAGDLWEALARMAVGDYHAVVLWGVDPARTYRDPVAWASHFAKVPARVWIGQAEDASAAQCQLLLPEHHWLEAWGDHRDRDWLTLQQPAVGPLYDTRQGEDLWLGVLRRLGAPVPATYRDYLQARWLREVRPAGGGPLTGDGFRQALHDGLVALAPDPRPVPAYRPGATAPAALAALAGAAGPEGLELVLRPGTQVHDGRYANNPWLQELPDPVSKATWGNPLSVSVADARRLGLRDGDLAELALDGATLALPVVVQPGQAEGVLALALGYGGTGAVARGAGRNAFPLVGAGPAPNLRRGVRLAKGSGHLDLPLTQHHHRMEGRDLVRALGPAEHLAAARRPRPPVPDRPTLYDTPVPPGPRWGMAIDLAACVGCSACVLACQAENNVPTVGAEQVARGREMHWLRIDRYYQGDPERPDQVLLQPMLCQHCEHAPCENVCPVNATNHSPDGLNQMVYNRCVGTRYCANNCPYKVRRFNFLEYQADHREPASLVHNPEVTVRPRGVMEKCTFCVQRIQDGRMRAMAHGRAVQDGEITPACAAACPGEAMVFGDLNDPRSRVARMAANARGYQVLDELGTRPAITYLADLRNPALAPEGGPGRTEAAHGA